MEKAKKRVRPGNIVLLAITIILAFLFIYPVLFALLSAFKSNGDILKNPVAPPTSFYIQNFKELFAHSDFAAAILHSVFLTVVSEILIVCIVPMAAYGIERRKSRFTMFTYTFFLSGMMIPFHLYMFPLFKEMKMFHMFGNMVGPVVCYISGSIAFGCLLYSSFLKGIPLEIEEAAMIDGCTPFQTFHGIDGDSERAGNLERLPDAIPGASQRKGENHYGGNRRICRAVYGKMGYRICRDDYFYRSGADYFLSVPEVFRKRDYGGGG